MLLMIKNKINSITAHHQKVVVKKYLEKTKDNIGIFKYYIRHGLKPIPRSPQIFLSHKYKFVSFPISKVASRKQCKFIRDLHKHKELTTICRIPDILCLSKKYDDYYKWMFVRNPWDRLLSCYLNKIHDDIRIFNLPSFPVLCVRERNKMKYSYKLNPMTFEDFVKFVYKTPDFLCDGHFLPQHYFIPQEMDFIGRFENLETDMSKLLSIIAPDCGITKFEKKNASSNPGGKAYREHYTDETREMVARKYARDIELFDYQF